MEIKIQKKRYFPGIACPNDKRGGWPRGFYKKTDKNLRNVRFITENRAEIFIYKEKIENALTIVAAFSKFFVLSNVK